MGFTPSGENPRTLSRGRRSAGAARPVPGTAGEPAQLARIGGARGGRGEHGATEQAETEHGAAGRTGTAATGLPGAAEEEAETPRLWHVVLSLAGEPAPLAELRRGLEQLAHDHPFLLTGRYAEDHAEIRYWEQARDLHDAAAIALRLWGEHKASARLPAWEIVGLEVVDRATYHKRIAEGFGDPPAFLGGVHPY